jgi:hypothetical protein
MGGCDGHGIGLLNAGSSREYPLHLTRFDATATPRDETSWSIVGCAI